MQLCFIDYCIIQITEFIHIRQSATLNGSTELTRSYFRMHRADIPGHHAITYDLAVQ